MVERKPSERHRAAALARWNRRTPEQRRAESVNAVNAMRAALRRRLDPDGRMTAEQYRQAVSRHMADLARARHAAA